MRPLLTFADLTVFGLGVALLVGFTLGVIVGRWSR